MKHSIKSMTALLLLLLLCFTSCEDFVEVDTPNYLLSGETIFSDSKTVEAAMVNIYAQLRNNVLLTGDTQGLSNLLGQYTDELDYYSSNSLPEEAFYNNALLASNPTIEELWNGSYNQIYAANAILEGVGGSSFFTPEEKGLFIGEAKFIRGLIHFYLMQLYGEIPYITNTDYNENKTVKREPLESLYIKISTDLKEAINLLPETDPSGEHVRPDKRTAKALLARMYLYAKNWTEAEQWASDVIGSSQWETAVENVFLKESPSTLWQFQPGFEGTNTLEARTFIFETTPPPARAVTTGLIDAFETDDARKINWLREVTDGTHTWYHPHKYKQQAGDGSNVEYSIVMRLAEQYLIRAEARANLGNAIGAQDDINKIRQRAGLNATTASTTAELLEAILNERRVEFFTEHGHRFFDLKRTTMLNTTLESVKPGWENTDRVFPIPEKELLVNPNLLPQNPGY
ncbi:RagB/SusD family nutrient uptake outer membrane protein [Croceibacter atlanticus]|uniref:RagB/SusD family nutrient uptake outer membrane protein n=1 Tax=Croceibacter atlanticus TaxID=313588 RepID=UPI002493539A|nr:RagB/SusD family nutrient uptake outer membrane protein [Croceibacter atlanticus]